MRLHLKEQISKITREYGQITDDSDEVQRHACDSFKHTDVCLLRINFRGHVPEKCRMFVFVFELCLLLRAECPHLCLTLILTLTSRWDYFHFTLLS